MENLIPGTKRLNLAWALALKMHQYRRKRSIYSLALCMPYACLLSACYNWKSYLIASTLSIYGELWGGWERGKYYNQPRKPATDKRNSISVNGNKRKAWMQSNWLLFVYSELSLRTRKKSNSLQRFFFQYTLRQG